MIYFSETLGSQLSDFENIEIACDFVHKQTS